MVAINKEFDKKKSVLLLDRKTQISHDYDLSELTAMCPLNWPPIGDIHMVLFCPYVLIPRKTDKTHNCSAG